MVIRGPVRPGRSTKQLAMRLRARDIALIDHPDLDEASARALVGRRVRAVLNAGRTLTGRYPARGGRVLLEAGVPVIDSLGPEAFERLRDGDEVELVTETVVRGGQVVARGRRFTPEAAEAVAAAARENLRRELDMFWDNTARCLAREKDLLLACRAPAVRTPLAGRQVLVVVRGGTFREDVAMLRGFIRDVRPALIGVDGGADALLEAGLRPDIVVGDMDSVSDRALQAAREIVVHAYPDGRAPGLERVRRLGRGAVTFAAPGTSEDIGLLLAYEHGAELIVAVGIHAGLTDFLDKGRCGMASTLLVRMLVGGSLVDARGVCRLYRRRLPPGALWLILVAAALPLGLLAAASPLISSFVHLVVLQIRLALGV
jgi:uncharacterized membrane-anchored protein